MTRMSKRTGLRLFIASPLIYPPRGGAELRFWRYLPGLRARGVEVQLVTGTPKAKKISPEDHSAPWYHFRPGQTIPLKPVDGVPIHQIRLPDKNGWRRTIIYNRHLVETCRRLHPDVVQLLTPLPVKSLPWLLRLKRFGIGLVYSITLAPKPAKGPLLPAKRMLRKILFGAIDGVIVSSSTIKELVSAEIPADKIVKIPNGVDIRLFSPATFQEKEALRRELGLPADSKIILNVGSIHPRKRVDLLLNAWRSVADEYPNAILLLVGPRHDLTDPALAPYAKKLKGLVSSSGHADRVLFLGSVDRVQDYYKAADLFVFSSAKEGMPNAVLEAMATGLPVITTPFIGLSDDFGMPGQHYVLADPAPERLSSTIIELLSDPRRMREVGNAARRLISNTMDREKVLDRYVQLYSSVASRIG